MTLTLFFWGTMVEPEQFFFHIILLNASDLGKEGLTSFWGEKQSCVHSLPSLLIIWEETSGPGHCLTERERATQFALGLSPYVGFSFPVSDSISVSLFCLSLCWMSSASEFQAPQEWGQSPLTAGRAWASSPASLLGQLLALTAARTHPRHRSRFCPLFFLSEWKCCFPHSCTVVCFPWQLIPWCSGQQGWPSLPGGWHSDGFCFPSWSWNPRWPWEAVHHDLPSIFVVPSVGGWGGDGSRWTPVPIAAWNHWHLQSGWLKFIALRPI